MTRPEWVEAVEKAMDSSLSPEFQWWESSEERITFILGVAEPLIRADERSKAHAHSTGTDTGGPCCECCYEVNQGPCSHDLTLHDEKIRADERERMSPIYEQRLAAEVYVELAHAEAVSARLVEVICEQEEIIAAYRAAVAALVVENDNLRAKIADDIEALAVYLVDDQSEPGGPSIIHQTVSLESVLDIARGSESSIPEPPVREGDS